MTSDADPAPVPPASDAPASSPADTPSTARRGEAAVVLSGEHLRTGTEWVESGRVLLCRRIVTRTRTIEVVVRREEFVVETEDVAPGAVGESYRGTAMDGPAVPAPTGQPTAALVVLLREEVPEVVLRPQVYGRVTAEIVDANETAIVHDSVRHEEADITTTST